MIVGVRTINFEKESFRNWGEQAILKENHHPEIGGESNLTIMQLWTSRVHNKRKWQLKGNMCAYHMVIPSSNIPLS
jgi:hypothetical protein